MTSPYDDLDRPPLHGAALRRALVTPGSLWSAVELLDETPSTNAWLRERAAAGSAGEVVIAEHQTAGRGRLARTWISPPRSGLTMSVLLRPHGIEASRWSWLPLLTGLAVAAAIQREGRIDARVKWPNDVVVDDRKLAGILVERVETTTNRTSATASADGAAAVIGIGLNVSLRAEELPVETATSLLIEGAATTDRSLLARAVLRNLEGLYNQWHSAAGDAGQGLHQAYADACVTLNRHVRIELPDGSAATGPAVAIDSAGRLIVATSDGNRTFGAGDIVHLRPKT